MAKIALGWRAKLAVMAIVSVLLALASYQLVERYIAEQNQVVQQQEQEDLVEILVSSIDLEIGSTLDPMSMVIRSYPSAYVQEDWLRPKDAGLIAGLTTTKFIERGEPLTPYAIAPDYSGYFSDTLAAGYYAITVGISPEQLHSGLLTIGDKVTLMSVLGDTDKMTEVLLPKIEVIALDNISEPHLMMSEAGQYMPSTVTFAMTQAQALQFEQMRAGSFEVWLEHPQFEYQQLSKKIVPQVFSFSSNGQGRQHEFSF
ncbi:MULTISPECIES: Flp pilus assembly protein CpaB [Idiomarinaceae]|uniref:Flp pilus assembly protein CpaB n=4 Tax=Pseudidiomarina TaxID=2800384 RepID=A0A368ULV7_9GAMM|nr:MULTISPECIES: Flp pilus assembly protein CpaB [Idiomarinaceae]MDT7526648.1 Flp pilus assembly protein CpaB [Pseudidiomarina sp. GXY010]MDX1526653.1 Flp pilus assembly protein CpaB [Pseudidiomarina maritima]MRJ41856.1 Flp pilus assembly protein CpaB [Idiomarina sp. FeN1]NCU57845.1 Flp pilus assembly protein CpaB [Idiomarina sp. FenA--70]NCU60397.1 Flp pilus assembly protein CpaB [Idiomarina sp. FenBw--71]